ncbi:hypothetical protein SAMN02910301_0755 [Lachnospiraceae bacterium XBD2001]|nr:hypothetical protein SAMN02910301_0755 [Lachnospiraceae bacterium XBD2001]
MNGRGFWKRCKKHNHDFLKNRSVKKKYLTLLFVFCIVVKVIVMEEKIRQGYLYDFYGELLNDHQRSIFEAYVLEDLSLAEVAEAQGISRQGVHDLIRRCTKTLEDYESRLHLIDKFMHIRDKVDEIRTLTQQDVTDASMGKIESIASEILEEL